MVKAIKPKDSKTRQNIPMITRETVIGDMMEKNPSRAAALAETMLRYGLHCVGCHANVFDTIENGARLHGMDDETIDKIIADLNTVLNENVKARQGISITEKAAAKIKELQEKDTKPDCFLRIDVQDGGCAGHTYDLAFDNQKKEGDIIVEDKNVKLVMSAESRKFLEGSIIDFVDTLQASGFKIDNPNVTRSCSCGESFG